MTPNFVLDEASMLTMEARIPDLAEAALRPPVAVHCGIFSSPALRVLSTRQLF